MTRDEKLKILFDELSSQSLAFQVGYFQEIVSWTIPDKSLDTLVNGILRPYGKQLGFDLEGQANAGHH